MADVKIYPISMSQSWFLFQASKLPESREENVAICLKNCVPDILTEPCIFVFNKEKSEMSIHSLLDISEPTYAYSLPNFLKNARLDKFIVTENHQLLICYQIPNGMMKATQLLLTPLKMIVIQDYKIGNNVEHVTLVEMNENCVVIVGRDKSCRFDRLQIWNTQGKLVYERSDEIITAICLKDSFLYFAKKNAGVDRLNIETNEIDFTLESPYISRDEHLYVKQICYRENRLFVGYITGHIAVFDPDTKIICTTIKDERIDQLVDFHYSENRILSVGCKPKNRHERCDVKDPHFLMLEHWKTHEKEILLYKQSEAWKNLIRKTIVFEDDCLLALSKEHIIELRKKRCFNCKSPNNLKKCSNCKCAYYCSEKCQEMDWECHKRVCFRSGGESCIATKMIIESKLNK